MQPRPLVFLPALKTPSGWKFYQGSTFTAFNLFFFCCILPFLKHQLASFTTRTQKKKTKTVEALDAHEPYRRGQMGLLIFDRQADIGFWFLSPVTSQRGETWQPASFLEWQRGWDTRADRWRGCVFNNLGATMASVMMPDTVVSTPRCRGFLALTCVRRRRGGNVCVSLWRRNNVFSGSSKKGSWEFSGFFVCIQVLMPHTLDVCRSQITHLDVHKMGRSSYSLRARARVHMHATGRWRLCREARDNPPHASRGSTWQPARFSKSRFDRLPRDSSGGRGGGGWSQCWPRR